MSLRDYLAELSLYDSRQVLTVRGITRMGFQADSLLVAYFSKLGPVRRVMVPPAKVKPRPAAAARARPGSFCFVVMQDALCVDRILARGQDQMVSGHRVTVERFTRNEGGSGALGPAASAGNSLAASRQLELEHDAAAPPSVSGRSSSVSSVGQPAGRHAAPAEAAHQSTDLAASLGNLVSRMHEWERSHTISGVECAEAMAVSRLVQLQLKGVLDLCNQRMTTLASHGEHIDPTASALGSLMDIIAQSETQLQEARVQRESALQEQQARAVREMLNGLSLGGALRPRRPEVEEARDGAAAQSKLAKEPVWLSETGPTASASSSSAAASGSVTLSQEKQPVVVKVSHAERSRSDREDTRKTVPMVNAMEKQTLGMHLVLLQGEDARCIFIVRKIGSMGFGSQELLAEHFSKYGVVSRVLVPHSKVKPFRSLHTEPRIRPGSIGFVVMGGHESVQRIFSEGKERTVGGVRICVEPFQHMGSKLENGSADTGSTSAGDLSGSNGSQSQSGSNSNGSENNGSEKSEANGSSSDNTHGSGSRASKGKRDQAGGGSTDSQNDSSESGSGTDGARASAGAWLPVLEDGEGANKVRTP